VKIIPRFGSPNISKEPPAPQPTPSAGSAPSTGTTSTNNFTTWGTGTDTSSTKTSTSNSASSSSSSQTPPSTIVNPNGIPWTDVISRADPTSDKFKVNDTRKDYWGHCGRYGEFSVLNHGGVYDGAINWKDYAKEQNRLYPGSAPAGTAVFYDTDSPYEHVTISAGNGYVWTTGQEGQPIRKVKANEVYDGAKPFGWTDVVQGKKGGDPTYIQYDTTTAGADYKPTTDVGASGSSAGNSSTEGNNDQITPTPGAGPAPTPPSSNNFSWNGFYDTAKHLAEMYGSAIPGFNNLLGLSQPNQTVAKSAGSSITPGMSSQFDNYMPSTNQSTTSGSSPDSLESTEPNSDVTVKPVGS
jgi:hypothetical protein